LVVVVVVAEAVVELSGLGAEGVGRPGGEEGVWLEVSEGALGTPRFGESCGGVRG